MNPRELVRLARDPAMLRWATQLVRALERGSPGGASAWAREVFEYAIEHPALDGEVSARQLYVSLVMSEEPAESLEHVRNVWLHHHKNEIETAVVLLWTGLRLPGHSDELGKALEILLDHERLGPSFREAALLLFSHYIAVHEKL